jgi:DNA-binding transcriptional MerR regulator/effector-binding domain-containing protein
MAMFTIGEFSKVTGMTVKTLRFYHEAGLLVPTMVDDQTGYRYYDEKKVETARVIAYLRELEFPVEEIKDLLRHAEDEGRVLDALERQKAALADRIRRLRKAVRSLDQFISDERQVRLAMTQSTGSNVEEKTLPPMLIAGVRMRGRYSECGKGFAKIGRSMGRYIAGPCFLLHYDAEYKEDDADFEACFPVRQAKQVEGIAVRELPGGRCVSLLHTGPYDQMGPSYAKVLKYVKDKRYRVVMPTREVYLKGPGMIFKGNPKNYLTEIQVPIAS